MWKILPTTLEFFFLRIETSTPLTMIGELPLILYFHWLSLSIHSILKQNHIWWNWINWGGRKEMKNLRKCQIFNLKKHFYQQVMVVIFCPNQSKELNNEIKFLKYRHQHIWHISLAKLWDYKKEIKHKCFTCLLFNLN